MRTSAVAAFAAFATFATFAAFAAFADAGIGDIVDTYQANLDLHMPPNIHLSNCNES